MKTFDEITNKDFFYCYDQSLTQFLTEQGIRYFLKARSMKDGKVFTMFKKNQELTLTIHEYMKSIGREENSRVY
ncbi:MAG TPA: hypothetical protein VNR61_19160 [Niallia sp.]|nr:hypothetical protein [Niallia sp.]